MTFIDNLIQYITDGTITRGSFKWYLLKVIFSRLSATLMVITSNDYRNWYSGYLHMHQIKAMVQRRVSMPGLMPMV